jgi:outer membrane protein assembly factor BamB
MRPIARPIALALIAAACAFPSAAVAQRARSVFPDEGVGTQDALVRVRELSDAGNMPEALRVLQKTLETEGGQLIQSPDDPDIYIPVRTHIHDVLLASPELLTRYRVEQEPAAKQLLEANRLEEVEATRLLTPSGFEAALRLAQSELEFARFESARLMLQQLERHPDRVKGSRAAQDAARLAAMLVPYLPREDVRAWAARWATEAGLEPVLPDRPAPVPSDAAVPGISSFHPQRLPNLTGVPTSPLQSVALDLDRIEQERTGSIRQYQQRYAGTPWIIPTLREGVVYVNDGRRISAWDAATLGELWQVTPSRVNARSDFDFNDGFVQSGAMQKEDAATVTVSQGVAVAVTGIAEARGRRGDRRIHAIEAATGRLMWSVDPALLSEQLVGGAVYGPPVVEADTVVVAVRSVGFMRRETRLYMVGLNLYTGALKWSRLVGTMQNQQLFGRSQGRPDGAVLHQGIVYRGDEIGVLCAYEACTGRPVWLRTMPSNRFIDFSQFQRTEPIPPQEMCLPVIDGDALAYVEYPKGRVVRVALSNGALLAKRDGASLGDPRYLLKVGEYLVCVGGNRIAIVESANLEEGTAHLVSAAGSAAIQGRVTSAGGRILVPLEDGASLIDPKNPGEDLHADFICSGNLLVAGEGDRTHLLAVDATRLHTFLRWEEAEAMLTARVAANPKRTQPLLTFIELASRTGRSDRVPELADRALALLDAQGFQPEAMQQRSRLFTLLLELVRNSRLAWTNPNPTPELGAARPIKNVALLEAVIDRLSRAAESSPQIVAALLERAWLAEKQNNAPAAIEAYQQILVDSALCAVELDPEARLAESDARASSFINARAEATDRLIALVKRVGPAPYAAFDEEAARRLAETDASDPEALADLARSYPVAAVTSEAWDRASAAYAARGQSQAARLAAGAGLSAAELSAFIGRDAQEPLLARLAGSLLARSSSSIDAEPAYRLMQRLAKQAPALAVEWDGSVASPSQIAQALRTQLASRSGMPLIGPVLSRNVQVIEGWEPMEPVVRHARGNSGDCVVMSDESGKRISMWAVAAEDGRLRMLWSKSFQMRPIVVRITPDETLLFWPSARGGAVECVGTSDGATRWRTAEFASLFQEEAARDPNDRVPTPLDGPVRPNDLVVTSDGSTLVLVQRRGRAGAFDLTNGQALWNSTLELNRVYEIEQAGDHVVIGGTTQGGRGERAVAGVIALHKRTGEIVSRVPTRNLGDHARWIRAAGEDVIIATATGLLRFSPASGQIVWSTLGAPGASSFAGWVVGEGLFVLDGDVNLWWVSLRDGSHADRPLDSRGRIVFPVNGVVMGNTLAISSTMGLVVFGEHGELLGADGLDGQNSLQTPIASEKLFVAVENNQRDEPGEQGIVSRVFMFAHPTGKLLNTERVRLYQNPHATMVLDGKLLLTEGPVTLVLDAPPQ